MKYGTVFYEKLFLSKQWQSHFENLEAIGIRHLEVTPHAKLIDRQLMAQLAQLAQHSGMTISCHTPDFVEPELYDLGVFSNTLSCKAHWDTFFSNQARLSNSDDQLPLVFHGASHQWAATQHAQAADTTYRFFDWATGHIIKNFPELQLLIENTCPLDHRNFGQNLTEIARLLSDFQGAPVGFCLDTAHYLRTALSNQANPTVLVDDINPLIQSIRLIHSHGYSTDFKQSHLPFAMADDMQIHLLHSQNFKTFKGPIVFEILSYQSPSDETKALENLCQVINLLNE